MRCPPAEFPALVRPPGVRAERRPQLSDAPGRRGTLDYLRKGERPERPIALVQGRRGVRHVTWSKGESRLLLRHRGGREKRKHHTLELK